MPISGNNGYIVYIRDLDKLNFVWWFGLRLDPISGNDCDGP